ncbi:MAG TPA: hypothetical protein VEL76_40370 [Gemmataceae bacterium]|nr:hypothetical protein [Gemmataceae bacterium]
MSEAEWLEYRGIAQWKFHILRTRKVARTKAGRRRLRLFACGCCRLIWDHLPDNQLRDAVLVAERFAEGQATKDELGAAYDRVARMRDDAVHPRETPLGVRVAIDMAVETAHVQALEAAFSMTTTSLPLAGYCGGEKAGEAALCDLLRCIFGNLIHPVAFDPAWRTTTVKQLALGIYDERAFDRMPILADALEDAGCTDPVILDHCRGPGPHVRGCWVLDLLLGKK